MRVFRITIIFCLIAVLSSCAFQKYKPSPISPVDLAASFDSRTLSDPDLHEFIASRSQRPLATWPLKKWNIADLTLAAFFFNPALQIARSRVAEAEGAIVTAGMRPNPNAGGDVGGEKSADPANNPWIAGAGFSLPIETAGKRRHRITQAQRLADSARWTLAGTAWTVRSQVRSAILDYVAAQNGLAALKSELQVRSDQVTLLQQRLDLGMISRPEVNNARIVRSQTFLAVRGAEGRISQTKAALAATIGIPTVALNDIEVAWPNFEALPQTASLQSAEMRKDAVLNRIDISRALSDYAAAEATLQVEVSKQYPDLELSPA